MSADTIPAEVREVIAGALRRVAYTDRFNYHAQAEAVIAALADRSTRPAEPAPEVEVGDGEVVAWLTEWTFKWPTDYKVVYPGGGSSLTTDAEEAARRVATLADWERVDVWTQTALVRLSTLEAERAKTAAVEQKLRDANADRSQLLADLQALRAEMATRVTDMQDRAEAAEAREYELRAAISRAPQDRDEAVRVAVEKALQGAISYVESQWEEYTREFGVYDPSTNAVEFSAAAESVDGTYSEIVEGLRARLRADQRAGDGGAATPLLKQEEAGRP